MLSHRRAVTRREGNALIVALGVLIVLAGLAAAQSTLQQKNLQQSRFYAVRTGLHNYAESGIALAVHEIRMGAGASPGNIGTVAWDLPYDYGRDGIAGTGDEGEGDGFPTPGEPGVFPADIGPEDAQTNVVTHVFDTGLSDVIRVVATASNPETSVSVEKHLKRAVATIPRVGAVYVAPGVVLDFKGNVFTIDGRNYSLDEALVGSGDLYGIATTEGANPGDNKVALLAQIPTLNHDQVIGIDGMPSLGETTEKGIEEMIPQVVAAHTKELAPGSYSNVTLGDIRAGEIPVIYTKGDLLFAGQTTGAGILVVDGNVKISGQLHFDGLVIVRGDIILTGGGAGIHVLGSLMVTHSITAIDEAELTMSGNADILFSQEVLDIVEGALANTATYEGVYYNED
ncbi:MAG: hypothetical protein JXA90_08330 [Planctomycetes bacterium]|nr:hypothetical protein [Planctomycetota bacterium]